MAPGSSALSVTWVLAPGLEGSDVSPPAPHQQLVRARVTPQARPKQLGRGWEPESEVWARGGGGAAGRVAVWPRGRGRGRRYKLQGGNRVSNASKGRPGHRRPLATRAGLLSGLILRLPAPPQETGPLSPTEEWLARGDCKPPTQSPTPPPSMRDQDRQVTPLPTLSLCESCCFLPCLPSRSFFFTLGI